MDNFLLIKILYSAASIQGLFLAIMLARTPVNQPANRILAAVLLLLSFHLVLVGFDNREFFMTFPHLSRISWIIGSLYWPLLFLFLRSITQTPATAPWKNLWAFIPFVIFLIIMLPYYTLGTEDKRSILTDFEKATEEDFGWMNQIISLLHIFFQCFFLIYYLQWERKKLEEFSAIESVRIKWLRQFLWLMLGITAIAVVSFFFRSWHIPVLSNLYYVHFIGVVFLFYWLSYKALTHPVIFGLHPAELSTSAPARIVDESSATEKYARSTLDDAQLELIFQKVLTLLQDQKLYLKNNLTLTELASLTGFPRHQVSQAINTQYTGNFFDLVNDYRIQAFKEFAVDPGRKNLSLLGVAQEAGFNSKASFYAVFKKKTGMTPSEFLEKQV